jgi:ornithine cyclodeaminase/alanine dehydrogenase-like protein (mu-crystallin family)
LRIALKVLFDSDVRSRLDAADAVRAARRALVDAYKGLLAAPPRLHADLGERGLVFTAGGYVDGPVGFRVYGLWPGDSDQAVLVWDGNGRLAGCVVGTEIGARRTGALGGAAVDALARANAATLGIVGSGVQAWTQLWAISAVRGLVEVRVFSPTHENREAFARRAEAELGLSAAACDSAEEAIADSDLVVLATRSERPVIEAGWIRPGTHVNTVGPKLASAHETPPELAESASAVVTDSPEQAARYGEPFFTPRALMHLGGVLTGDSPGRTSDEDITLYCSTGLAGSEVVLAETLLATVEA